MFLRDDYISKEDLHSKILYKRITFWDENLLTLEDGTILTIEESEYDCCASAGGKFSNVKLDAVITDINYGDVKSRTDQFDTTTNKVVITFLHNQNPIAQADVWADDGNGGYYYSVASLVINGLNHCRVLET